MGEPVSFTVLGDAAPYRERTKIIRPKGRAGYLVTSKKEASTSNYQAAIRMQATSTMAGRDPLDGSVELDVTIYMAIPRSWPSYKQEMAETGALRPCQRPDATNVLKCIEDAMSSVVFVDDAYVADQIVRKRYSRRPRLEVTVRQTGPHAKDVRKGDAVAGEATKGRAA